MFVLLCSKLLGVSGRPVLCRLKYSVFLEGVYRASQATLRKRGFSYLGGFQYRNTHIILGEEAMNTVCSNKIKN